MELLFYFSEDSGDIFYINTLAIFIEKLDETAHVRPLKMVGKVHVHIKRSNGMLGFVFFVLNNDRIFDVFNSHLLNLNVAVIRAVLEAGRGERSSVTSISLLVEPGN